MSYSHARTQPNGFTLVEIVIVISIITFVLGASMTAGQMQLKISNYKATEEKLRLASAALDLFHQKYNRYPCPADITLSSSDASYGMETDPAANCAGSIDSGITPAPESHQIWKGGLPFQTLGLQESDAIDAWENKIIYVMDEELIAVNTSATPILGDIRIDDENGNQITQSAAHGHAIYLLASAGENMRAATKRNGSMPLSCSVTIGDAENCDNDTVYVDKQLNQSETDSDYYDDILLWRTATETPDISPPAASSANIMGGIFLASQHACFTATNGRSWCWGDNTSGKLGIGSAGGVYNLPQEITIPGRKLEHWSTSRGLDTEHNCAIDNTGTLWCWGRNDEGQVGTGNFTTPITSPTAVTGLPAGVKAISVAVDYNSTLVVLEDGRLFAFGDSAHTLFPNDTPITLNPAHTPTQVDSTSEPMNDVTQVAAASRNGTRQRATCVLKTDDSTWCWGDFHDEFWAFGGGLVPVQVGAGTMDGTTAIGIQLMGGNEMICLRHEILAAEPNNLWCWGQNTNHRLGTAIVNNHENGKPPAPAPLLSILYHRYNDPFNVPIPNITNLGIGIGHVCAVDDNTNVWCWGDNVYADSGQPYVHLAGKPYNTAPKRILESESPDVELSGIQQVSCGDTVCCAAKSNADTVCWGMQMNQEFGDGNTATGRNHIPVPTTRAW